MTITPTPHPSIQVYLWPFVYIHPKNNVLSLPQRWWNSTPRNQALAARIADGVQGLHATRIPVLDVAFWDVFGTIVGAYILSRMTGAKFMPGPSDRITHGPLAWVTIWSFVAACTADFCLLKRPLSSFTCTLLCRYGRNNGCETCSMMVKKQNYTIDRTRSDSNRGRRTSTSRRRTAILTPYTLYL